MQHFIIWNVERLTLIAISHINYYNR